MKPWRTQPHSHKAQFTISSVPLGGPLRTLDDLLAHAGNYAGVAMKSVGGLQPVLFVIGSEGPQMLMPSSMASDRAKDDFAIVARLLCVAKSATVAVMASEAWVSLAKPGDSLDTTIPPSQAPDHRELVVIMGEDRARQQQRFLPIVRDEAGKFVGFGEFEMPQIDQVIGRFAQFLAPAILSSEQCAQAEAILRNIGVESGFRHAASRPPRYRM